MTKESNNSSLKLQQSEARLRRAELASKSGNWELHWDSKKINVSEGAGNIYGVDKNQFEYAVIKKCALPEYRPMLDAALKALIEENNSYDVEFKIKKADTGEILDIHSAAEFDKENRIVFGVIQDITERKQSEEALRESEERFKALNDITTKMLGLTDLKSIYEFITETLKNRYPDTIIVYVLIDEPNNKSSIASVSGLEKGLLNKVSRFSGFNPVDKTYNITKEHNEYFRSGNFVEFKGGLAEFSVSEFPAVAARATEKIVGLNKIYTIGINKDEKLLAAIHFFTYKRKIITDSDFIEAFVKQAGIVIQKIMAETELTRSKEKANKSLEMIVSSQSLAHICSYSTNLNEKDVEKSSWVCSPEFYKIFGIDETYPHTIAGWAGFIHPDHRERVVAYHEYVVKNRLSFSHEYKIIRINDGVERWVKGTGELEYDEQGKPVRMHGAIQDITELKESENELIKAKQKAEESDRLKSSFLANMSHEVRTPMNGILGFASLLERPNLKPEAQQKFINSIKLSGERMLNTINDIVDISKIEAGMMKLNITEFDINERLENIFDFFRPEADTKGVKLVLKHTLSPKESWVKTDDEKIYAILTNLVKNAIKFTAQGSIEIGCNKKDNDFEFYVQDTGVGIADNQKDIIFDRFRQESESISRQYEGSGLGLSISKNYVEMLGGKMWFESQKGRGSTFYFTIPAIEVLEEKTEGKDNTKKKDTAVQKRSLKILIAEDDEASSSYLLEIIQEISSETLHVYNGVEAVDACRNNPDIDLVLMDIKMPDMDGYEATRQIRQFNKDVVIIAQTAYGFSSDAGKAREAGCNDYISKPIAADLLNEIIPKHCS